MNIITQCLIIFTTRKFLEYDPYAVFIIGRFGGDCNFHLVLGVRQDHNVLQPVVEVHIATYLASVLQQLCHRTRVLVGIYVYNTEDQVLNYRH